MIDENVGKNKYQQMDEEDGKSEIEHSDRNDGDNPHVYAKVSVTSKTIETQIDPSDNYANRHSDLEEKQVDNDNSIQQRDSSLEQNVVDFSLYQRFKRFTYSRIRSEIDEIRSEISTEPNQFLGLTFQK